MYGGLEDVTDSLRPRLLAFAGNVKQVDVAAYAEGETAFRILSCEAGDSRDIPLKSAGKNLNTESRLRMALRSHKQIRDLARGMAPRHFSDQAHPAMERVAERAAVEQHVVLAERLQGCLQDSEA